MRIVSGMDAPLPLPALEEDVVVEMQMLFRMRICLAYAHAECTVTKS